MKKFVAIAGNIGVGKSTLVQMLCERTGWEPFYEPVTENPYLADFYSDMNAWAFHSQVFFLTHRLRSHYKLSQYPESVVQDRSVYEDAEIFARNLYQQGQLGERDWQTYFELYQTMSTLLRPPHLMVYLRASVPTLRRRIVQRGRGYEQEIADSYLAQLNELYESWAQNFALCPLLTIDTDGLDYVQYDEHFAHIWHTIERWLKGKEFLAL